MSIQTEINRIAQNMENTYAALGALGCDIPEAKTSDNLAPTAGTAKVVLYKEQALSDEQKEQARKNINASSVTLDRETKTLNICSGGAITSEELADDVIGEIEKIVLDGVEIDLTQYVKTDNAETWTFTLEDGSTVDKKVVLT